MSAFKIEKEQDTKQLFQAHHTIAAGNMVCFQTSTINLLGYDLSALTQELRNNQGNRHGQARAIKVISCSLQDKQMVAQVENAISSITDPKQLYDLLLLWANYQSLNQLLGKLTLPLRKHILSVLFSHYFVNQAKAQEPIRRQLPQLLKLIDSKTLMQSVKTAYKNKGGPLIVIAQKCKKIKSNDNTLNEWIASLLQYALTYDTNKTSLVLKDLQSNSEIVQYLLGAWQGASALLVKHLKQHIKPHNVLQLRSTHTKVEALISSAVKEWFDQAKNYWNTLDHCFSVPSAKVSLIQAGKHLTKQHQMSQCLSIKYLYLFMNGSPFDYAQEDTLATRSGTQNWGQVYRAVSRCDSYKDMNLVTMNVSLAPTWWRPLDPFSIGDFPLKGFLKSYAQYFKAKKQSFMSQNKKLQMAFSVFIVRDKNSNKTAILSMQQLQLCLSNNTVFPSGFQQTYPASKTINQQKKQVKRQHNILVQARLVRILKRSKVGLNLQQLSQQSEYPNEIVQLAIKRLLTKGIAEQEGTNYIYVP